MKYSWKGHKATYNHSIIKTWLSVHHFFEDILTRLYKHYQTAEMENSICFHMPIVLLVSLNDHCRRLSLFAGISLEILRASSQWYHRGFLRKLLVRLRKRKRFFFLRNFPQHQHFTTNSEAVFGLDDHGLVCLISLFCSFHCTRLGTYLISIQGMMVIVSVFSCFFPRNNSFKDIMYRELPLNWGKRVVRKFVDRLKFQK